MHKERTATQHQLEAIQELTYLVQKIRLENTGQKMNDATLKQLSALACKYGVTIGKSHASL